MAERKAAARRRRQRLTVIGAGATALLVVAGTVWLVMALGDDDENAAAPEPSGSAAPASCSWIEVPADQRTPTTKDAGLPPASGEPRTGTATMTINTTLGPIEATIDRSKVPCTAASFTHLAGKKFFDNTKCHRLVIADQLKVLQCGDPSTTAKAYTQNDGTGGPTYRFAEENLPVGQRPTYPEGVIAMAKTQQPASTGSQFFIVFGDSELPAEYTVLGRITKGLDIVKNVAKAGHAAGAQQGDGNPKTEVRIKTLTMTPAA
jgi:peptidyl-prolyl cis-trans isomerase B (cyclophilin B)